MTAQQFVEGLIDSLQNQKNKDFLGSFHQADLIVIEDLEYLRKKKRSQATMVALVSELLIRRKTIIFSINIESKLFRMPKRIKKIVQGFSVLHINPAVKEMKAIARYLLANFEMDEPESVYYYLSRHCSTISQIKAAINTYQLLTAHTDEKLTIEWLDMHLPSLITT